MHRPKWRRSSRGRRGPTRRVGPSGRLLLALLAAGPGVALAQFKVNASVDAQYQYNSNVYDLPVGSAPPVGGSGTGLGDQYVAYGADVITSYRWSQQSLSLDLGGQDYRYDHFSDLSHFEYHGSGDFEWKLGSAIDGSIAFNRSKQMVAFFDLLGTELSLETNQNEHATANFLVGHDWRIETGLNASDNDSPRPGLPDLSLREDSGQIALKYVGRAGLSAGLSGQYLTGSYAGVGADVAPSYHQTNLQFVATYTVSTLTAFDAGAGYTTRSSITGIDNLSAATGQLSYRRTLTGKTSVKLSVSRAVNSYITDTGSEIDTAAIAQINYKATYKISLAGSYTYTYSDLPGQALNGVDRLDHFRVGTLNLDYQITPLFDLQPYARFETRGSNLPVAQYHATVFGVWGYLRWQPVGR